MIDHYDYEQCEGYPDPNERDKNGNVHAWPMFGYPSAMLNLSMALDDPKGFRFYFDRYFSLDAITIGGSIVLQAAHKGAPKVVNALIKLGAKDDAGYTPDDLRVIAKKAAEKKQADQRQVA